MGVLELFPPIRVLSRRGLLALGWPLDTHAYALTTIPTHSGGSIVRALGRKHSVRSRLRLLCSLSPCAFVIQPSL